MPKVIVTARVKDVTRLKSMSRLRISAVVCCGIDGSAALGVINRMFVGLERRHAAATRSYQDRLR